MYGPQVPGDHNAWGTIAYTLEDMELTRGANRARWPGELFEHALGFNWSGAVRLKRFADVPLAAYPDLPLHDALMTLFHLALDEQFSGPGSGMTMPVEEAMARLGLDANGPEDRLEALRTALLERARTREFQTSRRLKAQAAALEAMEGGHLSSPPPRVALRASRSSSR